MKQVTDQVIDFGGFIEAADGSNTQQKLAKQVICIEASGMRGGRLFMRFQSQEVVDQDVLKNLPYQVHRKHNESRIVKRRIIMQEQDASEGREDDFLEELISIIF